MRIRFAILLIVVLAAPALRAAKPNVVFILSDNQSYYEMGCHGHAQIKTPHIDSLAKGGVRFSQFYNASRCCPTRASLLTGLYAHQTGVGWMVDSKKGGPGYRGDLNNHCVTIAEVLRATEEEGIVAQI